MIGDKMDLGVIGIGNMGKNHLRVYSELRWVDQLYCFDIDSKKLSALKDKFEDTVFCDSLDDMLNKIEAASICVPTENHLEIIKKCLEKGISVLVEKPVVSNSSQGEELLDYVKKNNVIFGVGHIERFNPIVKEISKLVNYPRYIEIKRHNPSSRRMPLSSVVDDLMIHDIDLVWNIIFKGLKDYSIYSVGDDNFCTVLVSFGNNIASISASRFSSRKIRTIYIEDEHVSIEGNFMDQELFVYKRPTKYTAEDDKYTQENIIEKVLINKVEPLKEELKQFIESVKSGKPFPVTLEQALLNLRIVEVIKDKL